jgi:hypothetical protein
MIMDLEPGGLLVGVMQPPLNPPQDRTHRQGPLRNVAAESAFGKKACDLIVTGSMMSKVKTTCLFIQAKIDIPVRSRTLPDN